jgi:hypothetical protein
MNTIISQAALEKLIISRAELLVLAFECGVQQAIALIEREPNFEFLAEQQQSARNYFAGSDDFDTNYLDLSDIHENNAGILEGYFTTISDIYAAVTA